MRYPLPTTNSTSTSGSTSSLPANEASYADTCPMCGSDERELRYQNLGGGQWIENEDSIHEADRCDDEWHDSELAA